MTKLRSKAPNSNILYSSRRELTDKCLGTYSGSAQADFQALLAGKACQALAGQHDNSNAYFEDGVSKVHKVFGSDPGSLGVCII